MWKISQIRSSYPVCVTLCLNGNKHPSLSYTSHCNPSYFCLGIVLIVFTSLTIILKPTEEANTQSNKVRNHYKIHKFIPKDYTCKTTPLESGVYLTLKANNWYKVKTQWNTGQNKRGSECKKHTPTLAVPIHCHPVGFYISTNQPESSSAPWTKPLCVSMQLQLPRCPTWMHDPVWRGWGPEPQKRGGSNF